MTFSEAVNNSANDEARTVIARAVCNVLGIGWNSDEAERLGDWLAMGEYSGSETPESIAAEWQSE